ncbi:fasciclin domain-containing protein [Methanoculleus bourgensis]|uniref:fasciclin domain-containing protein n=1 Tax=Methanoculleus TaxID=45989 RepID=UPI000940D591|nr:MULTISPECIES: fasciclin domain-containing protein [Methanoculleus]MBT0732299.1 fasciclin domain-containing protein [Methanoculleus bourgensis]MDD3373289.1 fasciclin domain-containing protein [Methanoculleus bourgensis]NMA88241.1 fasciclin domain-containing protein [Methanoculleus bourgensis]NQS73486.1 fasciclin domain-containing protein [Methanoculleus sp.]
MRRWTALCICILALLAMPFAVTAALVGDENVTATPDNETGQMDNMTIAGYVAQDENLTKLAEALNVTALYDALDTGGPYTVFAPSDDAFDALGNETVNQLFNETANLTTILQYHVVEGKYTSANLTAMAENQTGQQNQTGNETGGSILDIFGGLLGGGNQTGNMTTLETLSGESLNVTVSDGEIMVENATVTMKDINTTNGVIHIIDQVLVPPGMNLTVAENQTGVMANETTEVMTTETTM